MAMPGQPQLAITGQILVAADTLATSCRAGRRPGSAASRFGLHLHLRPGRDERDDVRLGRSGSAIGGFEHGPGGDDMGGAGARSARRAPCAPFAKRRVGLEGAVPRVAVKQGRGMATLIATPAKA